MRDDTGSTDGGSAAKCGGGRDAAWSTSAVFWPLDIAAWQSISKLYSSSSS